MDEQITFDGPEIIELVETLISGEKRLTAKQAEFGDRVIKKLLEIHEIKSQQYYEKINGEGSENSQPHDDVKKEYGSTAPTTPTFENQEDKVISDEDSDDDREMIENIARMSLNREATKAPVDASERSRDHSQSSRHTNGQFDRSTAHSETTSSIEFEPVCTNIPRVNYTNFVSPPDEYLKMRKKIFPFEDEAATEKIKYPLSVVYDEVTSEWYICEKEEQKIIRINTSDDENQNGISVICSEDLKHPSALCCYKEGSSIAILTSETSRNKYSIVIFHLKRNSYEVFATYNQPMYNMYNEFRGLAKSYGGNIMSLESSPDRKRKLRVFRKGKSGFSIDLPGAKNASFIASSAQMVAVSDLGTNKVFLIRVNDANWDNFSYEIIRVLESKPLLPHELANTENFAYVAGMQFDRNGNLLIGDAKGHTIKLFDPELAFLHRLSSDFPIPYMSSFFVNEKGEMLIIDIHSRQKFVFAQLGSTSQVEDWNTDPIRYSSRGRGRGAHRARRGDGGRFTTNPLFRQSRF